MATQIKEVMIQAQYEPRDIYHMDIYHICRVLDCSGDPDQGGHNSGRMRQSEDMRPAACCKPISALRSPEFLHLPFLLAQIECLSHIKEVITGAKIVPHNAPV